MILTDWVSSIIDTAVGVLVGAVLTLLTRASKADIKKLEDRLLQVEKDGRLFVTDSELKALEDRIRGEFRDGLDGIRVQLAQIQAALMEKR